MLKQSSFEEIVDPNGRLRIAGILWPSRSHGPGSRFSIWLQGCRKRCIGCINPQMQPVDSENMELMEPSELLRQIRIARDSAAEVRGITLQGGEPTLQAGTLAPVLEQIRKEDPKMNVLMFTGYKLELLRQIDITRELLKYIDTVIDGPYKQKSLNLKLIRGSTDQRIIHLTDALKEADFGRKGQEVIVSTIHNTITYSGIEI